MDPKQAQHTRRLGEQMQDTAEVGFPGLTTHCKNGVVWNTKGTCEQHKHDFTSWVVLNT